MAEYRLRCCLFNIAGTDNVSAKQVPKTKCHQLRPDARDAGVKSMSSLPALRLLYSMPQKIEIDGFNLIIKTLLKIKDPKDSHGARSPMEISA